MFSVFVRALATALVLTGALAAGPAGAAGAPPVHWVKEAGVDQQLPQDSGESPLGEGVWGDFTYHFGQGFDDDIVADRSEPVHHDGSIRLTTKGATGAIENHFRDEPAFSDFGGSYWSRSRAGAPARYVLLVDCSGRADTTALPLRLIDAGPVPTGHRWHHVDVSASARMWRAESSNNPLRGDGPHPLSAFMEACPLGSVYGYGISMPAENSISYVDGVRYGDTATDFLVPPLTRIAEYANVDGSCEATNTEFYSPGYVDRFDRPQQHAKAIVVAKRGRWGDAIAGGALANALGGQLFLATRPSFDWLHCADYAPGGPVYLIGDRTILGDDVAQWYRDHGHHSVRRITAAHAHDLDVAVAKEIARHDGHHRRTVLLATRHRWHDALAASAVAGKLHGAVLYTEGHRLSKPVARYLAHHPKTRVIAVGPAARDASRHLPHAVRIARHTIAGTAAALARRYFPGVHTAVFTAEGGVTQALPAGTFAGQERAPVLFVFDDMVPAATRHYVRDHRDDLDANVLIGDEAAVMPSTFARLTRMLTPR